MPAHHAFEEFGASRAHESVDAKDLARTDGKTDMIDSVTANCARQADLLRPHDLVSEFMIARNREVLGVRANHLPDDPMDIDVFQRLAPGHATIPKDGDEVADPYELLQ